MSNSKYLRSAVAALGTVAVIGFAAPSAHAQGTTVTITSTFSGTFSSTHMDTNGDGLRATSQNVRLLGPLGASTLDGINEFAITGPGTCASGNPGTLFSFLSGPAAPSSLVQRAETNGDLLFYNQMSGSACFDSVTGILSAQASGVIVDGTGALKGAKGTFTLTSNATFLFFNLVDAFGPQSGTFTQTVTLP